MQACNSCTKYYPSPNSFLKGERMPLATRTVRSTLTKWQPYFFFRYTIPDEQYFNQVSEQDSPHHVLINGIPLNRATTITRVSEIAARPFCSVMLTFFAVCFSEVRFDFSSLILFLLLRRVSGTVGSFFGLDKKQKESRYLAVITS